MIRTIIDKLADTLQRAELGVNGQPLRFVYADEGLQNIIITTIFASVFGAIGLLILTIKNKGEKGKEYPFATFIVPSAIVSMLLGDVIANWYLSLFAAL